MVSFNDINKQSTLVSKNLRILSKRTSVRLEPEMWAELQNIAVREDCSIHSLCSLIAIRKEQATSLTAAIRVFVMLYFRASSTEEGHTKAGHGSFENMKRRAGVPSDWEKDKSVSPSQKSKEFKSSFAMLSGTDKANSKT